MASVTKLAIIWMHGLGDTGASWRSLQSQIKVGVPVKWQFPDAPVSAVTCNDGYEMTSWFDIEEIPVAPGAKDYPDDIDVSVKRIHGMIADLEKEGYDAREIVVGGFSQGGAMSLQAVLRYPSTLGGAVCLSGWLMMPDKMVSWVQDVNKQTPIFWGHGDSDHVVQFALQMVGTATLKENGVTAVTAKSYKKMQHSSCVAEIQDIEAFLRSLVG